MAKYEIFDEQLDPIYFGNDSYSYRLDCVGDSIQDLIDSAIIAALDPYNGIELWHDSLDQFNENIIEYVEKVIKKRAE
jgi:hypothetical protein